MRTTAPLDRNVERIRPHTPFKKVLNDTLRAGIERFTGLGWSDPLVLKARPMGLRAGQDPAGFNQLADDPEAEAFPDLAGKLGL